ncbi:MAG: hypothetical protein KGL43_02045 [Burkholderiales bacterium]|nr:hypothetical protein [Burkholderiales bacterium]
MSPRDAIAALLNQNAPALLQGDAKALEAAEIDASDIEFRGLQLLAPPQAPAGGPLPLVLLVQKSAMRGWEVGEEANLMLAAFDPASGALEMAHPLVDPKSEASPPPGLQRPPKPPQSAERTLMTKVYRFDARERLELARRPLALVLHALAFDWISNGARVEPAHGAAAGAPTAIDPMPAASAGSLPTYDATSRHPALPGAGIDFKIEPLRDGGHALLASFAQPVSASQILPAPQALATGSGPREAVAVVRIGFAMVGLDQGRPILANWGVPVYASTSPAPGQRVAGHLAIDLRSIAAAPPPGRYAVYLFMGDRVAGPHGLTIEPVR